MSAMAILALVAGAACPWKINVVGELYVGELLLLAIGPLAAMSGRGRSPFKIGLFCQLISVGLLALIGYIVSDLARG
ncbi:MAG: hypothetical protein WCS09_18845, partial [Pseudomonadota bacterium]